MLKSRLLKSVLIPTLGISAIGSIAAISTSCGEKKPTVIHVTDVTLDKTSTTLDVGKTETLTATVLPENATDKSVTWASSDTNIASVDSNGKITAIAQGTATIVVATHDGGKTATCKVTVLGQTLTKYLIITANNQDSILELKNEGGNIPDLQYSIDGTNWSKYNAPINITQSQSLYLKGNNPNGWSKGFSQYSTLSITGDASITGNVMGLLDNGAASEEEGDITDIPCDYCFHHLFHGSTEITSVSEGFLPATGLTTWCYEYMFQGCTSLTKAPNLPATTLDYSCYKGMFSDCTSLTKAPELPATTLDDNCYDSMFSGCSSLTTAPALPATTLIKSCYLSMFQNCTSLTKAPELPATTLEESCYSSMFEGCISLTAAPNLPATTLADYCYCSIFKDCRSLNSIKIGYIGNYSDTYFRYWVNGVASSGAFCYNGSQTAQDFKLPSGWIVPLQIYIAITANKNSTLKLVNNGGNNPDLQYSTDGTNWSKYNAPINITQSQSLYLKGNNPDGWSKGFSQYSTLSITGDASITGNVMRLLDNGTVLGNQGDVVANIPCDYCFYDLFRNSTGITSISEDFLPATGLTTWCYEFMFEGCTSLINVPNLPATTLDYSCYKGMFGGCTSLTKAPELPATTLAKDCYNGMFYKCTSLTTAPELPATTLEENCYNGMFYKCTSLTTAPKLLATTLADWCYTGMFMDCASLITAPALPATTLASDCYRSMFEGCTKLSSIKIDYTGNYDDSCFKQWVNGVASSGTFYYNGVDSPANFGFPSCWTKSPF